MIHDARRFAGLVIIALLAACAGSPPRTSPPPAHPIAPPISSDGGPSTPPDISQIPEPVPHAEPLSRYGNQSPYNVLGTTYRLLPSAKGYVERGVASWYGTKFHGHMTSTFEPYDMYQFTAAHKTLPLPTYARVTNLENHRSIVVRINDRGPFVDNRIIDLSYVAAIKLGIWDKGTGLVEVRALDPQHPDSPLPQEQDDAQAAVATKSAAPRIYLQIGAYAQRANAEHAAMLLERAHLGEVRISAVDTTAHTVHRVRIGPLASVDEADGLSPKIEQLGLGKPRVAIDD